MARLIILIAVIAIALIAWHKIKNAKGEDKKRLIVWTAAGFAIAILGVLAITGRLNWITALIGGVVALIPRLLPLLKYIPLVNHFRQQRTSQQQSNQREKSHNGMTKEKAYEVLGLKPGANREDIITAHKRMMQKVHPDRGGSDYLAAEINQAKDTLLR
jgi:4-amino-4-deoxy-L-arabinose transferase-like glycosyltransferase